MLEYLSNTVSFLRVGGFVLAHAGFMSVVSTLADMSGGVGSVLIMAVGNAFVICLEGLIVGIQALRLNYYELFSRFYEADGEPFTPLQVRPDTVEL
jgi:V/A-type H+-transporting ATPase subunit I